MINSQNDLKNNTLQIKKYVLGFAFWRERVALIYKTKGPDYVIDTWNGIGGKIEDQDDDSYCAMVREFCEETGLFISPDMWTLFATQTGQSWDGPCYELNCFYAHLPYEEDFADINNLEGDGEIVVWQDLKYIKSDSVNVTPNLKWLIPLALDETTGYLNIKED